MANERLASLLAVMPAGSARTPGRTMARLLTCVVLALAALRLATGAWADGEAGLVIQEGDAVTTYCIAFSGDGITGDQLLNAAGQTFDAYGGGSGLALCAIGNQGCHDSGSFSSCFCQCQGGSCTYWAFFTQSYGKQWVYSALGFNLFKAKDGDIHGWKWGTGGPNNAPAPNPVTFEQICGHAPRGGAPQPTNTPLATIRPTLAASATSEVPTIGTLPAGTSTSLPATGVASTIIPAGTTTAAGATLTPLVTLTTLATQAAPTVAAETVRKGDDGSATPAVVGFGALVLALVGAIIGAAIWRSKRG